MAVQMPMSPNVPAALGAPSFLPLNQPLVEPRPIPRAIKLEELQFPGRQNRFSSSQLQNLLLHLPGSILKAAKNAKVKKAKTSTTSATTTTSPYTTTTPATTTHRQRIRPALPVLPRPLPFKYSPEPKIQRKVTSFNWAGLEKESRIVNTEESGTVFMVGVFNLLAVVVYAAYRHIAGEPALSDRVINWQVQKVLDELVLRVHSSDYASELLSRSMPDGVISSESSRSLDKNPFKWLQSGIQMALKSKDGGNGLQKWLTKLKDDLMTEVAGSRAARKSIKLNPVIYNPLKKLYSSMTKKQVNENSRAMISPWINEVGAAVVALGQLDIEQIQTVLKTLSMMRKSDLPDKEMLPIIANVLRSAVGETEHHIAKRSLPNRSQRHNSVAAALASSLTHAHAQAHNQVKDRNSRNSRPVNFAVGYSGWENQLDRRVLNSKFGYSGGMKAEHRMVDFDEGPIIHKKRLSAMEKHRIPSNQLMKRVGEVRNNHWTDGWFSLITELAPVALDITTLYARAKARPICLKSLLCQTNNAWKRVGAMQATSTPFLR